MSAGIASFIPNALDFRCVKALDALKRPNTKRGNRRCIGPITGFDDGE